MQVSITGEFDGVNRKLDDVRGDIHQEGAKTRTEVRKEGELIREAIRQTTSSPGKLLGLLPSCIFNDINFT